MLPSGFALRRSLKNCLWIIELFIRLWFDEYHTTVFCYEAMQFMLLKLHYTYDPHTCHRQLILLEKKSGKIFTSKKLRKYDMIRLRKFYIGKLHAQQNWIRIYHSLHVRLVLIYVFVDGLNSEHDFSNDNHLS